MFEGVGAGNGFALGRAGSRGTGFAFDCGRRRRRPYGRSVVEVFDDGSESGCGGGTGTILLIFELPGLALGFAALVAELARCHAPITKGERA